MSEQYQEVPAAEVEVGDWVKGADGHPWEAIDVTGVPGSRRIAIRRGDTVRTGRPTTVKKLIRDVPSGNAQEDVDDLGYLWSADGKLVRQEGDTTVQEFLLAFGVPEDRLAGISGQFGKRAAQAFRARHGDDAKPGQVWEYVGFLGRDHLSNVFLAKDRDILRDVAASMERRLDAAIGGGRPQVVAGGTDMFDALPPADTVPGPVTTADQRAEKLAEALPPSKMSAGPDPETTVAIAELETAGIATEPVTELPPVSVHHVDVGSRVKPRWIVEYEMSKCRAAGVPCGHELCRQEAEKRARRARPVGSPAAGDRDMFEDTP